jgi:hypothetical protein
MREEPLYNVNENVVSVINSATMSSGTTAPGLVIGVHGAYKEKTTTREKGKKQQGKNIPG